MFPRLDQPLGRALDGFLSNPRRRSGRLPRLLARAAFIGNQAGGHVVLLLRTDYLDRDYEAYRACGVRFVRPPAEHAYGTVAVFEDLYGNLLDLVQPLLERLRSGE